MLYSDRNETDLYDCFTPEELARLREIKNAPSWKPRQDRQGGAARYTVQGDSSRIKVWVSAALKERVDTKCGDLGITISDYVRALLEVTT